MEILRFEHDGDYDEEGPADKEKSKKQPQPQPPASNEGQYHLLRFIEPGHHELLNLQPQQAYSVPSELMKHSGFDKPEDDDEEDEEGDKKEDLSSRRRTDEAAATDEEGGQPESHREFAAGVSSEAVDVPSAQPVHHELEEAEPEPKKRQPQDQHAEETPQKQAEVPAHEALARPGQEPEWLEEDRKESEKILSKVFDKDHPAREAMSGILLKDTEPGQPPAVELTTNPNVSLEPEPMHRVEGFNPAGPGQQYEGYTPGPVQPAESSHPSFREQVDTFEREFAQTAQNRENIPAPQGVVRPQVRESTADLSRKIEHMGLRQKEAITWLAFIGSAGYIANKRRKQEISRQERELKKATKVHQENVERLAADQQALKKQFTEQVNPRVQPETPRSDGYSEQVKTQVPSAPEHSFAQPINTGEHFVTHTTESQTSPRPAEIFQNERASVGLPPVEGVTTPLSSEEMKEAERDAEAARHAIEEALAHQEDPQQHKHVEQDAWLRHEIDDRTGKEIEGAKRGREFEEERASETRPGMQQQRQPHPSRGTSGQPVFVGGGSDQARSAQGGYSTQDGQTQFDHSLPAGMPVRADLEHRLPEKTRNPIVETLTSPWLFLLLSLLLLAYFIATLF